MDYRIRWGLLAAAMLSMGGLAVLWWRRRAEISGRLREGRALWRELWHELKQLRHDRRPASHTHPETSQRPMRYVVDENSDSDGSGASTTDSEDCEGGNYGDPLRLAAGGGGGGAPPRFEVTLPLPAIPSGSGRMVSGRFSAQVVPMDADIVPAGSGERSQATAVAAAVEVPPTT